MLASTIGIADEQERSHQAQCTQLVSLQVCIVFELHNVMTMISNYLHHYVAI